MENIIVFGDCAIKSTQNSDFRTVKTQKTVKSKEEFNLELIRFEAVLREKSLEWENKKTAIMSNMEAENWEEEEKQKTIEALNRKEKKMEKDFEKKLSKYKEKQKKLMEKELNVSQKHVTSPNKSILEIKGCPPNFLTYTSDLVSFFNKKWSPTLALYSDFKRKVLKNKIIRVITDINSELNGREI
jgi:hypothetical protein